MQTAASNLYTGSALDKWISNSAPVKWFKSKFPDNPGQADKFDFGAAVVVVEDYNQTTARIGDGAQPRATVRR